MECEEGLGKGGQNFAAEEADRIHTHLLASLSKNPSFFTSDPERVPLAACLHGAMPSGRAGPIQSRLDPVR